MGQLQTAGIVGKTKVLTLLMELHLRPTAW